jgi:hypothetical protein
MSMLARVCEDHGFETKAAKDGEMTATLKGGKKEMEMTFKCGKHDGWGNMLCIESGGSLPPPSPPPY